MFTGIIEAIGTIRQIAQNSKGVSLQIDSGKLDLCDVKIGDSIAVNGICLTVTVRAEHSFSVDVSHETLRCATGLSNLGNQVNLEKAMRLSDRLEAIWLADMWIVLVKSYNSSLKGKIISSAFKFLLNC